jgi:hypothetical protein
MTGPDTATAAIVGSGPVRYASAERFEPRDLGVYADDRACQRFALS